MEDISLVTRAKLARELLLAPHQRRGAPCLRKLVLWSNLLGTQHANEDLANHQVQDHHPRQYLDHPHPPHPHRHTSLETASEDTSHHQQQNEAEFDWFEHLMDEIDDSDSESDSSDHTPERHHPNNQPERTPPSVGLILESAEDSSSTPVALIKQPRSKRARSSHIDSIKEYCCRSNELGRRTRRRTLSISSSLVQSRPRKQLGKHSRKRSFTSPSTPLPYWGFVVLPHLSTTKLNQEANLHPSDSSIRADEDEDNYHNSLPSLLSTKSSYLFESVDPINNTSQLVQNHDFGIQHPFISSKTSGSLGQPELNSIDFSAYDFLISTTTTSSHDQGNPILQVKYLIGNLGKFRAKSCSQSTTNKDEGEHVRMRIGKLQRRHHSCSSSSRGLIVKKIHVVFNHQHDFNHSHSDLYQNYYPNCLIHPFDYQILSLLSSKSSPFAWKVYGLHRS